MEEQIFKEEQDKLEEINEKITEEENIIEEDLKNLINFVYEGNIL